MSQVIYSALRADNPSATIDVLAPEATISLVRRMREVDRGILIKQGHGQLGLGYRRGLAQHLEKEHYDHAVITPNSLKSALVPFFAGIPHRTGFLGEYRYFLLNDIRLLDKKRMPKMTDRFLHLVNKSGQQMIAPKLEVDADNQRRLTAELELSTQQPIIGLCPGAEFGDAKKWPEHHYSELGRALVDQGHRIWIFGSPADRATANTIAAAIGEGCVNLAGLTSLPDAIDLIALCEQVVTNDSGLMHVAAAVGVGVQAIYGSTSPGFTPPISSKARIASLELDCSPCFKRQCPLGHKNCLNQLTPDRVLANL